MENFYDNTGDESLESILKELQSNSPIEQKPIEINKKDYTDLKANDLEQFILDNGAKTVENTQAIISILLNQIEVNPEAELITSVAEMVSSNNKALETLNKIYLNKEKFKQSLELEDKKAQAKLAELDMKSDRPPMTREEILKIAFGDIDIKDVPKNN